jgi:hypothetical protein
MSAGGMAGKRKIDPVRHVEQQQRQEEVEQTKARKAKMEAYLQQRSEARGIARGRTR